MDPTKQIKAIVEICEPAGWHHNGYRGSVRYPDRVKEHFFHDVPDILNSLDAVHEAVLKLDRQSSLIYSTYCSFLNQIVAIENSKSLTRGIQSIDATASQRWEAFLRAHEKWEE